MFWKLPEVLAQYMNLEALKDILRGMAKGAVNQANINAQELQKQFVEMKEQTNKLKIRSAESVGWSSIIDGFIDATVLWLKYY